jgi:hypothetical protein
LEDEMLAKRIPLLIGLAAAAVLCAPRPAAAIYIRHDVAVSNFQALAADPVYAATGYLRSATGEFCTGTLVAPTIVLSAAHCFVYSGGPKAGTVALPSEVMFGVGDDIAPFESNAVDLELNPNYDIANFGPEFDMALLTLSAPIPGVTPAMIWAGDPLGLLATIVGYGERGTGIAHGLAGVGPRLAAQNVIDLVLIGSLRFDFDSPTGSVNRTGSAFPVPLEGTPATGDSGGPVFALVDGTPLLVGTLTGGIGTNLYGDLSVYSRVAREENLGFLLANGIAPASAIPEPGTLTLMALGAGGAVARRRRHRP